MIERVLADPLRSAAVARGLALFVVAGAALYLGAVLWVDHASVQASFARIGAQAMGLAAVLASLAYLVRFARWQLCLRVLGQRVPVVRNLAVYIAGLALTTSPGKLGETLRSALLVPWRVPLAVSLAAFLADRLSDVLGVALLWWFAARVAGSETRVAAALVGMVLVGGFVLRGTLFGAKQSRIFGPLHVWLHRWVPARLADALQHWRTLWSVPRVLLFACTAVLAYGLQALVFAGLCAQAGVALPLVQLVAMFASSTLIGAASLVPGGLGAMELSLVLQLRGAGVEEGLAVSLAIATRLVTLWFGVALGILALGNCAHHLRTYRMNSDRDPS